MDYNRLLSVRVWVVLFVVLLLTGCAPIEFTLSGSIAPAAPGAPAAPAAGEEPAVAPTAEPGAVTPSEGEAGLEPLVAVQTIVAGRTITAGVEGEAEPGAVAAEITVFDIPTGESQPQGLTVAPDGTVWLAEGMGNKIGSVDAAAESEPGAEGPTATFTEFAIPAPEGATEPIPAGGEFEPGGPRIGSGVFPQDVQLDTSGNLWVSLKLGNQLMRVDRVRKLTERFDIPTENSQPIVLKPDPSGAFMWFPESVGNKIARINTATGEIEEFPIPRADSVPLDVAIDPATGLVYFPAVDGQYVGELNPQTGEVREIELPTPQSSPTTVTFDRNGMLWVTLIEANKLAMIDLSTGTITEIDAPEPQSAPGMIRTAPDGTLYFTAMFGDYVGEIDPETGNITTYDMPAPDIGPIDVPGGPPASSGPASISFADDGKTIWVTNMFSSQVTRIVKR